MSGVTPRSAPPFRAELGLLALLAGVWIAPWSALTIAAWVAGGRPSTSPLDFVNPARIARQLELDRGSFVWWHLVGAYGDLRAWLFWLALAATVVIPVSCVLLSRGMRHRLRHFRLWFQASDDSVPRASRWATTTDLRDLSVRRPRQGSFTLGRRAHRLIATEPETSVLVVGPTRSGKTSGLVITNLFEWEGPAIVTSTKSELVDITAAHRQSLGPVYVYDPTGELGDRIQGIAWSPLDGCDDLDRAWRVATWLCAGLQQTGSRGDNDWAHWSESGKLLLAPLLFAAARTNRTILDVHDWIHAFDTATPAALIGDLLFEPQGAASGDPYRASSMLHAIDQRPEKERGTVFSTVMRIFSAFNERAVAESALTCQLNPEDFLTRRGTLYLCTPRQSPERIATLFVGVLMSIVTAAYSMADKLTNDRAHANGALGLFLDEIANVVPVEELPALASQGAGRGVVLMSVVQDLSQLRTRYGQDRAYSIVNNHACKVVLPGVSDPETNDVLSRIIGRGEFTDVAVNHGGDGKVGRTYSVRHDSMAAPDALRQLRTGSAIVVNRGRPPTVVRLRPWYSDRRFRRFAERHYLKNADYAQRPG
jgi:type IV secretion system protein VirD4